MKVLDTYPPIDGQPMTNDRTCQETSELDPVIPREMWRSTVWEFFLWFVKKAPELFDVVAIREQSDFGARWPATLPADTCPKR